MRQFLGAPGGHNLLGGAPPKILANHAGFVDFQKGSAPPPVFMS